MSFSRLARCLRCRLTTPSPNFSYISRLINWDYHRSSACAYTNLRQHSRLRLRTGDVGFRPKYDYKNAAYSNTWNEAPAQHEASRVEVNRPEGKVLTEQADGSPTTAGYMVFKSLGKDSATSANNQDEPLNSGDEENTSTQPPSDHYALFENFLKDELENNDGEAELKSYQIGEMEKSSKYSQRKELLDHDRRREQSQSNTFSNTGDINGTVLPNRAPTKIGIEPDFSIWRPVASILKHEKAGDPKTDQKLRQRERNEARSSFSIHCRIDEEVLTNLDTLIKNSLTGYCELNQARSKIALSKELPARHWRTYQAMVRLLCASTFGIPLGVASPFVTSVGSDKKKSTYSLGLVLHDDSGMTPFRETIRRALELDFNDYSLSTKVPSLTTGTILCRGLRESEAQTLVEEIKLAYPNGIDLGVSTRCSLQHTLNGSGKNRPAVTDSPQFLMLGQDLRALAADPRATQVEHLWTVTMMEIEDPTVLPDYEAYRFRRVRHARLKEYKENIKNNVKDRDV
jgi:hypothetical protein